MIKMLMVMLMGVGAVEAGAEWGRTADDYHVLPLGDGSVICSDLNGGCWVAANGVGLVHIDRLGNQTWGDSVLWLRPLINNGPKLVPVDTGSVIVAMQRYENDFPKIYLHRITLARELLWGQDGVAIDSSSRQQYLLGIYVGPVENTYLIHWDRVDENFQEHDPRLQLINDDGEFLWGAGGIGLGSNWTNSKFAVTSDRCLLVAQNESPTPTVEIIKLNPEGECIWDSRFPILWNGVTQRDICDIESDRAGGAIFVYEYERSVNIGDTLRKFHGVNVMRISGNGDSLWARNIHERDIVRLGEHFNIDPIINFAGFGSYFVAWADYPNAFQVVALDIDGELQWDAPVDVALSASSYGKLIGVDSDSGACYVWRDIDNDRAPISSQQWGQRINLDGERLWGDRGRAIQTGTPWYHSAATDCNGGVITIVEFAFPAVQMMNRNGEIGVVLPPVAVNENNSAFPSSFAISPCYPNPFNSYTVIHYSLPSSSSSSLSLFDVNGRLICRLAEGVQTAGEHRVSVDGLQSGLYFVALETPGGREVRKIVCVR